MTREQETAMRLIEERFIDVSSAVDTLKKVPSKENIKNVRLQLSYLQATLDTLKAQITK